MTSLQPYESFNEPRPGNHVCSCDERSETFNYPRHHDDLLFCARCGGAVDELTMKRWMFLRVGGDSMRAMHAFGLLDDE